MTNVSVPQFAENCAGQGISLHPGVLAPRHRLAVGFSYQPDEWHEAVAAAGSILRQAPEAELIDAPIGAELLGEDTPTVAQMTLHGILNASLDRVSSDNPGTTFFCGNPGTVYSCTKAEETFADTFQDMRSGETTPMGWTIVTDDNLAIALTKMHGERSTLSFVPFVINGIPYPAGSLFVMSALRAYRHNEQERRAIASERIASIGFLRLSAFAMPPDRRGLFTSTWRPNASPMLRAPIEQLRTVAQDALPLSEVVR